MATARLYNLARMTTATTGTGTVTLGSAVTGFLTFAQAGVADGATVTYAIKDGNNSEIGRGVYTSSGTTLTRATILNSTNSNNALNLTGSAEVFITPAGLDYLPSVAAETGTTYTVLATDLGKLVSHSNAASIAVTLPQATGLFGAGWFYYAVNLGVGTVTITPTTSTINGAATLVLATGAGAFIVSDGTNYTAIADVPQVSVAAETGTTYTVLSTDLGKLVSHSNAAAIAVTLPQATGAFGAGWYYYTVNLGVGTVTITPTTSTINGQATLVLTAGQSAIIVSDGTNYTAAANVTKDLFHKADAASVVFTKTGAGTVDIKAGTVAEVAGVQVAFVTATAVTMPALTAGTDYAIYVCDDGTVRADSSFTAPSGYTTADSRQIGGFHYAPGENATGVAGGNTTSAINEYSLWDLKWRPACPDPRGMTLVAGSFWCDIYLTGVDHHTNGTSAYNVSIADGSSPPKIPNAFGGNGSNAYANMTWWVATEVLQSHGKRPLTYDEFAAAAYGTTEATSSGGSDVPTTGVNGTGATSNWEVFTSKWGVIQSTGCLLVWGTNFGGGAAAASWTANTGGRGSTYQMENVALWGGAWNGGANSGSRCSAWNNSPTYSASGIGARGRCDHLRLA